MEIQELKNRIKELEKENEELKEENFDQVYMKAIADYKDKIRNKIEELEEILEYAITEEGMTEIDRVEYEDTETKIEVLKELLGDDE